MCGIVYRKSLENRNISIDVLQLYKNQRSRGFEGFGFFDPNRKSLTHKTDEREMVKKLKAYNSTELLFHHRLPTSTKNVLNACHPFKVTIDNKDFVIVHNGYLSNEYELKEKHEKLGYTYTSEQPDGTFNDSEALAYDIALYLAGKQRKLHAKGVIAFIAYTSEKLYFGRNTNPLYCHITDKNITIRSEGRGFLIEPDTLYTLHKNKLTKRKLIIPNYEYATQTQNTWENYHDYEEYFDTFTSYETHYQKMISAEMERISEKLQKAYDQNDIQNIDILSDYLEELRFEYYAYRWKLWFWENTE